MSIGHLDLAIVAAYVVAVVLLGVWCGRSAGTAKDYLLGNRDLPWGALLISIVATETSAVTFLSVPGLVYGVGGAQGDLRFLQLPLGFVIGRIVAARFLLPLYFRGELSTAYEVLQRRFGPLVRGLASAVFLAMRTVADGLRLYLTASVVDTLTDLTLAEGVLVTGVSTLVYSFFGGVRGVVWTDVLQFAVYTVGALVAAAMLWAAVGGELGAALASPEGPGHLRVVSTEWTLADPHTVWAGVIGGAVLSLGTHGTDQLVVQRYLCARSLRDAQRALVLSGFVVLLQFALFLGIGLLLWVFYRERPPAAPFTAGDQVFADYIVHHLPTGVRGLVLGAVLAAAMSGSLNSSASALVNDIVLPLRGRSPDDPSALRLARWSTLLFGAVQMAVGLCGSPGDSVITRVLAIAAFTTGILLGLFFLAMLRGRTDERAALAAFVAGTATTTVAYFALPPWTGVQIAGLWFSVLGAMSTFAAGVVARLFLRRRTA